MTLAERQQQFVDAIQKHFKMTRATRPSRLFGVSNSAKIVEGGIQIGVANLNSARENPEAFVFACVMSFPPEDEVYFSILVRKDRTVFSTRLTDMKKLGTDAAAQPEGDEEENEDEGEEPGSTIKYSKRNNLVAIYIASDGQIWLRNSGFWNSLKIDLTPFAPSVTPDQIVFALYPPTPSVRRSLLARDFMGWLGGLVGREKVHELRVWSDSTSVSSGMQRMPQTIPVEEIEAAIRTAGGHYPRGEVRRYHAGLNFLGHKHFVILTGLSGTGKTLLTLKYARAVHGIVDTRAEDPFLIVCAVRPEWTDPTGLTGYYDVLSNRYVVPPFLEAVLLAIAYPACPVFVVLDEMNLARVEYYFSDVLSSMETGETLHLHSNDIPLIGSTGTNIRSELPLPSNLYITGTINVDETTSPISDKVLDRALLIDMSAVDLAGFLARLQEREPTLAKACKACAKDLLAIHDLMTSHGLGFGYRVAEEVVRYHAFASTHFGSGAAETLDDLMVQKLLVKLRGGERQRSLLTGMAGTLEGLPRSQAYLARLTQDLNEFGSFQASR
jgi:5-methylcytosine-specific restriction enzyme B